MIEHRPFSSLGSANHGWLDAYHHFSFADYQDAARTNWGRLRVWNDDAIAAGEGFPPHGHRDMEIITYVRKGAISHKDNRGNTGRTVAGDVQVMSAGTGIEHSEYNTEAETTQIFQIWIFPDQQGRQPNWGTRCFPKADRSGHFTILASGSSSDDALLINADARVAGAMVKAGETISYTTTRDRYLYLVAATGRYRIDDLEVAARDGLAATDVDALTLTAIDDSEIILVDTGALGTE
jgi:quercetin 2,3-dioxygenase